MSELSVDLAAAYAREYEGGGPLCLLLNHAVALARESEYEAGRASNLAQCSTTPAYAPWVLMLADAMRKDRTDD